MHAILICVSEAHDGWFLLLAGFVCALGIYASSSIATQAARSEERSRFLWASISIVASGCTAWATHMIALLAFRPGMSSGFDPVLTFISFLVSILGIAAAVGLSLGKRERWRRFLAGVILGLGITGLHYIGQFGFLVTGRASWNLPLVAGSVVASLGLFGLSLMIAGERDRVLRRFASPLLLLSIAVLHLCGMAALSLSFDPKVVLLPRAVSPAVIAPILATVCFGLLTLAFLGLRMSLAARARQRRDQQRLRELASLSLEGLAVCDGTVITLATQSLERLSGVKADNLTGFSVTMLFPSLDLDELPEQEERDADLMASDGTIVPVRVLRKQVSLGHKRQTVIAVRDQRERLRTEARMRALAYQDTLTGLPNRARLGDLISERLVARRQRADSFAVLLVDLDRFKLVNDTFGHGSGDVLLQMVGTRLQKLVDADGFVARPGGDEFAVVQTTSDDLRRPETLAGQIVNLMSSPFLLGGLSVHIGASVGVACAPSDGCDRDTLLRNAELAMYQAKAEGGATFRVFEPAYAERLETRRVLEAEMRNALLVGEFEVHYQPLFNPGSGTVTAAEALVRWRHPQRGLVSPIEFIPLAEETGLIVQLGEWVLRTACYDAVRWPNGTKVAVNLSPVQFRDDRLLDLVEAALSATQLPASRLELEITEGVVLHDENRVFAVLSAFRARGIGIAMDDFGTGYASLSYLRRFPFSKLKVDRSFVRNLPSDNESAVIMRTTLEMAAGLGMATTVEGVETAEQYAFVAGESCDQVQGYYISRPLPQPEFTAFLSVPVKKAA